MYIQKNEIKWKWDKAMFEKLFPAGGNLTSEGDKENLAGRLDWANKYLVVWYGGDDDDDGGDNDDDDDDDADDDFVDADGVKASLVHWNIQ